MASGARSSLRLQDFCGEARSCHDCGDLAAPDLEKQRPGSRSDWERHQGYLHDRRDCNRSGALPGTSLSRQITRWRPRQIHARTSPLAPLGPGLRFDSRTSAAGPRLCFDCGDLAAPDLEKQRPGPSSDLEQHQGTFMVGETAIGPARFPKRGALVKSREGDFVKSMHPGTPRRSTILASRHNYW